MFFYWEDFCLVMYVIYVSAEVHPVAILSP